MEGVLLRGYDTILPGCGVTSTLARGATLAARWLREPQPTSNRPVGLGFPHLAGWYIDPGNLRFRPRVVGVVQIWKDFCSGDGKSSSPGAAGPRRCPEGQLSPRAGSMSPSESAITQWGWGFYTAWGGIDPGDLCLSPRVCWSSRYMEGFLIRG